ncbi:MAG: recombinase RecA [Clostridiales bacterium]|jgi:recombination protein RecA|nr:recombinase RecA [Clostridiales bacterium]
MADNKKTDTKKSIEKKPESSEDKLRALETAIKGIEKNFGKGSIMKLGEKNAMDIDYIPTGSLSIDLALGIGGLPRGRIIEIYGPESSGKTTVALHIVAEAQKTGGYAAYIDAEHAMDPTYAKNIGVNIDELYISQPDDGEQALEIAEAMVRSNAIEVVVIDSVAALVPRAEISGDMGDSHMGLQARLMSQALRKLAAFISKSNCILIFINQLREKIGGPSFGYGPNETTTGGRALKFYASVRMEIKRSEAIKNGNEFIGNHTKVKISKNKVSPPFKSCEFDIIYGKGISRESDIVEVAINNEVISKSGSWYYFNQAQLGQGKENIKKQFIEDPELCDTVELAVREKFNLKSPAKNIAGEIEIIEPDEPVKKETKATKLKKVKKPGKDATDGSDIDEGLSSLMRLGEDFTDDGEEVFNSGEFMMDED